MAKARDIFKRSDDLHMASFPKLKPTEFLHGSYVLVKYREGSAPTRLHTKWRGPLKVLDNDKSEYLLYDLITHKEKPYHASDMKPFLFNPLLTDPLDVARKDYLEFFIEKVLDIKGDIKKLKTLEFQIKWLEYDDSYNSWEPWANIRTVAIVHEYLRTNNLGKIIPKQFRT